MQKWFECVLHNPWPFALRRFTDMYIYLFIYLYARKLKVVLRSSGKQLSHAGSHSAGHYRRSPFWFHCAS